MNRKTPDKDLLSSCSELGPEDNSDPRTFFRKEYGKKTNRKSLQLCGEVAKTISYALAWETGDDLLSRLQVESVVPAPNSMHLLVTVSSTESGELDTAAEQVMGRLQKAKGVLRALVAAAIHRRRAPDFTFHFAARKKLD